MSQRKTRSTAEKTAQFALVRCLGDESFALAFRQLIYCAAGRVLPPGGHNWEVKCEHRLPSGGRIDILATGGSHALIIETKIDDVEKLHQYICYQRQLKAAGFEDVCSVGIIGRKTSGRSGKKFLEQFFDLAADARITWASLISDLSLRIPQNAALAELRQTLVQIDPELLRSPEHHRNSRKLVVERNPAMLLDSFETYYQFCIDLLKSIDSSLVIEPSQAGNSPIGVAFGKNTWADWFGDGFTARLKFVFDRTDPPHFRFTIILWQKAYCHGILNAGRVEAAARFFSQRGYRIGRNVPGKWHSGHDWTEPFCVNRSGFLHANAFDTPHFKFTLREVVAAGWEPAISKLCFEASRVIADIESLVN